MTRRTRNTQDITRAAASDLLNVILFNLDRWTREGNTADRGEILDALVHIVDHFGVKVPTPCPGEAHSNFNVDHCGVCMPHWGIIHRDVRVR